REVQSRWLDRHRADGIVWAVIRSGLVDWQKLNKREPDFCNPINKLPQRAEIADSQIVLSSQRKKRHENPGDLLFRRQIHLATDEHGLNTDLEDEKATD